MRYPIKTNTKKFCDTIATSIARYEKYRCWASKLEPFGCNHTPYRSVRLVWGGWTPRCLDFRIEMNWKSKPFQICPVLGTSFKRRILFFFVSEVFWCKTLALRPNYVGDAASFLRHEPLMNEKYCSSVFTSVAKICLYVCVFLSFLMQENT